MRLAAHTSFWCLAGPLLPLWAWHFLFFPTRPALSLSPLTLCPTLHTVSLSILLAFPAKRVHHHVSVSRMLASSRAALNSLRAHLAGARLSAVQ